MMGRCSCTAVVSRQQKRKPSLCLERSDGMLCASQHCHGKQAEYCRKKNCFHCLNEQRSQDCSVRTNTNRPKPAATGIASGPRRGLPNSRVMTQNGLHDHVALDAAAWAAPSTGAVTRCIHSSQLYTYVGISLQSQGSTIEVRSSLQKDLATAPVGRKERFARHVRHLGCAWQP